MARSLSCEHAQCSHFRSMAEVSFLPPANTWKRASASREQFFFNINHESFCLPWSVTADVFPLPCILFGIAKVTNTKAAINTKTNTPFILTYPAGLPNLNKSICNDTDIMNSLAAIGSMKKQNSSVLMQMYAPFGDFVLLTYNIITKWCVNWSFWTLTLRF